MNIRTCQRCEIVPHTYKTIHSHIHTCIHTHARVLSIIVVVFLIAHGIITEGNDESDVKRRRINEAEKYYWVLACIYWASEWGSQSVSRSFGRKDLSSSGRSSVLSVVVGRVRIARRRSSSVDPRVVWVPECLVTPTFEGTWLTHSLTHS